MDGQSGMASFPANAQQDSVTSSLELDLQAALPQTTSRKPTLMPEDVSAESLYDRGSFDQPPPHAADKMGSFSGCLPSLPDSPVHRRSTMFSELEAAATGQNRLARHPQALHAGAAAAAQMPDPLEPSVDNPVVVGDVRIQNPPPANSVAGWSIHSIRDATLLLHIFLCLSFSHTRSCVLTSYNHSLLSFRLFFFFFLFLFSLG
jgi:hypothetical protein